MYKLKVHNAMHADGGALLRGPAAGYPAYPHIYDISMQSHADGGAPLRGPAAGG